MQFFSFSQTYSINGKITDEAGIGIPFATFILKTADDSTMVKADLTADDGTFRLDMLSSGKYFGEASYIGMHSETTSFFDLNQVNYTLPTIIMAPDSKLLGEVVVSAQRALIEVKADRTVFNVQGTINSAGENGLNLLRKAPGILVDNNNNVSVLGRSGVLLYVDGKRIPLVGDDLVNYLENLTSEQIDKIDIITNPGSKYEAQGNAGIIDIRLKKDKNLGSNGSVSSTFSHGKYRRGNLNANVNFRSKVMNTFGSLGYNSGINWDELISQTDQNGIQLTENNQSTMNNNGFNGRWGTDFFLNKKHTLGFLVNVQYNTSFIKNDNRNVISTELRPSMIDSILIAPNRSDATRNQFTYNINYAYESGKHKLNIDADYGRFKKESENFQPNYYYNASETNIISQNITAYSTPSNIDIVTAKVDFETEIMRGILSLGAKVSNVSTDNTFLFYNINNNVKTQNNRRSNQFDYNENVLASYSNYTKNISAKWNASVGLRVEKTDATGDLTAFIQELEETPVNFNYFSFFPSAGLTYKHKPEHIFSLNYGKRINRPDYNVLNPFREQLSELTYSKGNKSLLPETVNNIEFGYTLKYNYSFKLAYSNTANQITRLIGPDELDPRAGFISWDNLSTQKLYNFNVSLPFYVTKWWNAYMNFSASYTDNQANYGDGRIVDVKAGNYNIYQQHTFNIANKWKGEISGWYSGPGVWGGVFLFDPSYSLNFGIQRKFFNDQISVRCTVNDITYQSGWSGVSRFNGQVFFGSGNWDSRRVSMSLSYDFGNKNLKIRKRNTSIEEESKRVGS